MTKITLDGGEQRSSFCRAALKSLKKRAEGHAKQHPTLHHMLVLPEGEAVLVPARPGCHPPVGSSCHVPPPVSFGNSQVAAVLPPASCWPHDLKPIQAVVAEQEFVPYRPLAQKPYRVHLFFGDVAGMTKLQSLATDLVNLAGDVGRAISGGDARFFFHSPDRIHGTDAEILDAWLCTVHWWAWKATDSPIHTRPHVVFGHSAIAADSMDQAVVEKLSFSTLDCDVFTATAATIDLFVRFFTVPPDLAWAADYPPEEAKMAMDIPAGSKPKAKGPRPAESKAGGIMDNWSREPHRTPRKYLECHAIADLLIGLGSDVLPVKTSALLVSSEKCWEFVGDTLSVCEYLNDVAAQSGFSFELQRRILKVTSGISREFRRIEGKYFRPFASPTLDKAEIEMVKKVCDDLHERYGKELADLADEVEAELKLPAVLPEPEAPGIASEPAEPAEPTPNAADGPRKDSDIDRQMARKRKTMKWLAEAMTLVHQNPRLSNAAIARAVRIDPSRLSRNSTYKRAEKAARDTLSIPKGSKDLERRVEAIEDEDEGGDSENG